MPSFFVRLLCLVSSPRFLAWLFRPAFKDNKVISSFSTFLRLLLSFFDIPRIISLFSSLCLFFSLFILFSEPLGVLRIASLVSASLLFFSFLISEPLGVLRIASLVSASLLFLSVFSFSIFFYSISSSLSHLSISILLSLFHLHHHLFLLSCSLLRSLLLFLFFFFFFFS